MDKQTFQEKISEAEDVLFRVSRSICFNPSDCEDAVQEAIFKAWRSLKTLREEKYFTTWLVRILINECYKINKKRSRLTDYDEYVKSEQGADNRYSELYEAIVRLPEKIRVAVELHYIEGYNVYETAQILNIPEGTVKSRLSAGRNKLKNFLED